MILAAEDAPLEAIGFRLIEDYCPEIVHTTPIGLHGKQDLKRRARELNRAAAAIPVVMLADLDDPAACPAEELRAWLGGPSRARFALRFAVVESESWPQNQVGSLSVVWLDEAGRTGHNSSLRHFVRRSWNPEGARLECPSLNSTILRLARLRPK